MPPAGSIWRSPIVIIFVGCVVGVFTFGPRSTMGLFLQPMTDANGWSREAFSIAIAIQNLVWGIGQPLAGMFADRYGTWRVLAVGSIIHAVGLYIMSQATDPVTLTIGAGFILGMGLAGSAFFLVLAAFSRLVPEKYRGLAFGLGTAAGSFGQLTLNPIGQSIIDIYGYQVALIVLAILGLCVLFLAIPLRGKPETKPSATEVDQTIRQALKEAAGIRSYQLLTLGFFVCGFHVAFVTVHLPAFIIDLGIPAQYGGYAISLIGLFNIAGAIAAGYFGEIYSKRIILSLIYLGRAIVIAIFLILPPSPLTILVFASAMGLLWLSTIPPTQALVGVMFGMRYMATLFGLVFLSHQVGAFIGVWLGGYIHDLTGSYDLVWWLGIFLGLFAAIVHWPIREEPVQRTATVR